MKKLIIFDKDDTLSLSKKPILEPMSLALKLLCDNYEVAIISWAAPETYEAQVIACLHPETNLAHVHLLPSCGTSYQAYEGDKWVNIYENLIDVVDRKSIVSAIHAAIESSWVNLWDMTWWELIEDSGTQVSVSLLGLDAPFEPKQAFDQDHQKRKRIVAHLAPLIPHFECTIGGTTTINISHKGMNKAYWVRRLCELLSIELDDVYFVWDSVQPGWNDYSVVELWVDYSDTSWPDETLQIINTLLK